MQTLTLHTPQEIAELYKQLSAIQKNELFNFLTNLLDDEKKSNDEALERLIGCAKGAVENPLTIEEMNEIAAKGWAGEYEN